MKYTKQEEQEADKLDKYAATPKFVDNVVKHNYSPLNSDIWDNGIWDGSIDKE